MRKKDLEVIKIDKEKKKITLAKKEKAWVLFLKEHRLHIALVILIIALLFILVSTYIFMTNLGKNEDPKIKGAALVTSLSNYGECMVGNNAPITIKTAQERFLSYGDFKSHGEALTVKVVDKPQYKIKYYSDGTALKINKDGLMTRITFVKNGEYGIEEDGTLNSQAKIRDITIIKTKEYPWGTVTYFSDGSAEVVNSQVDLFVRNYADIDENYISSNKISYLKETKQIKNSQVNYYYDGMTEVIDQERHYFVRNSQDIKLSQDEITFPNNNYSYIYHSKTLDDGIVIHYLCDGGAIIVKNNHLLSVRKSNSIHLKDNKIYEIVNDIYVDISHRLENGNIIYYTNGGATFKYHNKIYYTEENSYLKYQNKKLSNVDKDYELLTKETNVKKENVKIFKKTAVIKTDKYIAIIPQDGVLFDQKGHIKELLETDITPGNRVFTITNNSNQKLKYRLVITESKKTDLDSEYILYQLQIKDKYYLPQKLNANIWNPDKIAKSLDIKGTNYILVDSMIEAQDTINIRLMLWTDYETIPNTMQDKHFYGTIKVYAWTEK